VGDAATLAVQNPYWGPASALVVWGNRLARKQKAFPQARRRRGSGRGSPGLFCARRVEGVGSRLALLHQGRGLFLEPLGLGSSQHEKNRPPPAGLLQIGAGLVTLPLGPLGAECRGGCGATVVLSVARPAAGKAAPALPPVPVSRLFDPLGPHTPLGSVQLRVAEVRAPVACVA
jgi:hypothetical protein